MSETIYTYTITSTRISDGLTTNNTFTSNKDNVALIKGAYNGNECYIVSYYDADLKAVVYGHEDSSFILDGSYKYDTNTLMPIKIYILTAHKDIAFDKGIFETEQEYLDAFGIVIEPEEESDISNYSVSKTFKERLVEVMVAALKNVIFFSIDSAIDDGTDSGDSSTEEDDSSVTFDSSDSNLAYYTYTVNEEDKTVEVSAINNTQWEADNGAIDLIVPSTLGGYQTVINTTPEVI